MAVIEPEVQEPGEGFARRQVYKIPNGLYGLMFAWYSLPKTVTHKGTTSKKFYAGFVVVTDRSSRPLPHFSQGIMGIKSKLYYDATTGMKSAYLDFLFAMLGGRTPYEQIIAQQRYDLDTFLGRPALAMIEKSREPDKDGLFGFNVGNIQPADNHLIEAIKPLYKERRIEVTNGHGRLEYPCTAYAEDIAETEPPSSNGAAVAAPQTADEMFS